MAPLSLPLYSLLKHTECLRRTNVFFNAFRGLQHRPPRSLLWIRNFGAVSRGVGQLLSHQPTNKNYAASVCSSSSDGQDTTRRLWSVYNETKRQTEGTLVSILTTASAGGHMLRTSALNSSSVCTAQAESLWSRAESHAAALPGRAGENHKIRHHGLVLQPDGAVEVSDCPSGVDCCKDLGGVVKYPPLQDLYERSVIRQAQRILQDPTHILHEEFQLLPSDLIPSITTNSVNPDTIFANNEMSLRDIEIYGFDYDYTLAFYSSHLHTLIFNIARDILITNHRYPEGLRKYEYIPDFAVRGLHYDVQKALLMKIDAFHYIQLGTVYRGLHPVSDEEVIAMYEGCHVPLEIMSDFYGKSSHGHTMKQFMDIFSLPEMTLLSCVNDFFMRHNIDYEPVHLYKDVKEAIRDVHVKGIMYRAVEADIEKYICYGEQSHAVLKKLSEHGKKMFLITNSPFDFVDRGMSYIVGKDWRDLFDVVIVQADKPSFFNDRRKPFRRVTDRGALLWDRIHKLEKGQIYKQGNLYEFLRLTGWRGSKVLYFGDHIYSDLADLTLKHGWRTGAIIPELRKEIKIMNTEQYVHMMTWLQALTGLIEHMQVYRDPASQAVVEEWIREREDMRPQTKDIFNAQFGSLFRTYHNPTYFSRRLSRFADIYMASISCLLNYDYQHTFFPRRTPLQHESPFWPERSPAGLDASSQLHRIKAESD